MGVLTSGLWKSEPQRNGQIGLTELAMNSAERRRAETARGLGWDPEVVG